jgi:hypothetical protein
MGRIDKYDPAVGGFRAALAANQAKTPDAIDGTNPPIGVGLDGSGHVVPGAGVTGILGVLALTMDKVAGDVVDVMTAGEMTEMGGTAGTVYYAADADGTLSDTAGPGSTVIVGWTVEVGRLVVRVHGLTIPGEPPQ